MVFHTFIKEVSDMTEKKDIRSTREKEAAELEAKAKAIRRAEKAFWQEVESRLPEVKTRFHLTDEKRDFHKPAESAASSFQMHTNKGTPGSAEGG
jgi:hypothetical protein